MNHQLSRTLRYCSRFDLSAVKSSLKINERYSVWRALWRQKEDVSWQLISTKELSWYAYETAIFLLFAFLCKFMVKLLSSKALSKPANVSTVFCIIATTSKHVLWPYPLMKWIPVKMFLWSFVLPNRWYWSEESVDQCDWDESNIVSHSCHSQVFTSP